MKKNKQKIEFSFMRYIWKHKWAFILYTISLTIFYLGFAIGSIFEAKAIAFITEANYSSMLLYTGYATISAGVARIFGIVADFCFAGLVRDVSTQMRQDLTERIFKISSKSFGENSAGMFVNRIAYSPEDAVSAISDVVDTIGAIVSKFVVIFYIMFLNVYVGLLVLAIIALLALLEYFKIRAYAKNRTARKKAHDEIVSFSNEVVRSEKDIKSLDLEGRLRSVSTDVFDTYKKARYKEYTTDVKFWSTRGMILEIFAFGIVCFSLFLYNHSLIALSALLYIFMNRGSLSNVIWSMGHVVTKIADIRVENFRMKQIFNDENFPIEKFGDIEIPVDKVKGKISFKKVTFSYEESDFERLKGLSRDTFINRKKRKQFLEQERIRKENKEKGIEGKKKTVIKNMSFTIPAGKTVAFVGRSGSGKLTILSLIPKLYECESGSVMIDDIDVKNLTKQTLRENISLVNQFPYIFNASIKENLLMANKDATDEMIVDALQKASLYNFVNELSHGIDTVVGENGIKLSGGQRQRLAIARALLKKSKIILFDESTSSLDNFAQEDVRKSIEALENKTVVIVAHRLSTIRDADIIFFIDDGKIIAKGSFKELFENNENFRDMFVAENLR